jgi:hypothetical protein
MKTAKQWCSEPNYLSPDVRERWVQAIQSDALWHAAAQLRATSSRKQWLAAKIEKQAIDLSAMPNEKS